MKVQLDSGEVIDLGTTATAPTIGIIDYSRRVTDDYGVTTVVERAFARRMSVQVAVPFETVDAVQRRLADLRATSALWIADERFASLSVRGFYKEFSIDIASPPLSYCTLSVEGLTGTDNLVDTGNDPAPADQTSTLQLVQPVTIANAQLVASNVAENDAPEWSASVAYARGVRVIKTATHRIYESVAPIVAGDDPEGTSVKWLNVGPTNRWAMFDQALGSMTTANRNVAVTVNAGAIDSVALLDVAGDTVRIQATGYDRTLPVAEGAITFLDLPANPGQVTVTVIGGGVVSIGTLIVGKRVALGLTEASPTAAITDYSRKVVDEFGEATVVPRAWAKRMTANALIRTKAIDFVMKRISAVRATPCLWIGQDGLDSLTIYGFFKDFSIEVGEGVSKLALTIEGLSTAGKVEPLVASAAWPDITDPTGTKPADNADVTGDNTSKDTNAVAGKPAGEVADAVSAPDGSTILTRDVKAALLVATSAIASATAAIAAAEGQIAAAQSLIDSVRAQAATAQGRADQALSEVAAAGGQIDSLRSLTATQGSQIETNTLAISNTKGDLATFSQRVTAGSPNLVQDATFANGLKSWPSSGGSWDSQSGTGQWGSYAYLNTGAYPGLPGNTFYSIDSAPIVFDANAPITAACDADVHAYDGNISYARIQIICLGSNGREIDGTRISGAAVADPWFGNPVGQNRNALKASGTTPAGTVSVIFRFNVWATNRLQNAALRAVKVERSPVMTAFSAEASFVQTFKALSTLDTQYASLSSTVSTQGASVTQNANALSSLGTTVANLSSTVTAQGATVSQNASAISSLNSSYGSLSSLVSSQGSQISANATAISTTNSNLATLTSSVVAGNPNLVRNPTFANGMSDWVAQTGKWLSFADTSQWGSYAYLDTGAYPGLPGGSTYYFVDAAPIALDPGARVTASCDADAHAYDGNTAYAHIELIFLGSNGVEVNGTRLFGPTVANPWFGNPIGQNRTALRVSGTVPAGAVSVLFRFVATATDRLQNANVRQVKVERGATMTAYSAEATAVQTFKALSTLDTQYASLSTTVSTQGASITQNANALSSLGSTVASLSSTVSAHGASISQNAQAISSTNQQVANLTSTVSAQGVSISQTFNAISAVQNNVNLALARWAIRLDVNGRWIGIEANNNGSYGEIDIVADKFKISDPNGSVGIEVGGGSIRTYHPNGRLATRQGRW
jgi:septal ring factor EnvC (AmiA/AmiB activator)